MVRPKADRSECPDIHLRSRLPNSQLESQNHFKTLEILDANPNPCGSSGELDEWPETEAIMSKNLS